MISVPVLTPSHAASRDLCKHLLQVLQTLMLFLSVCDVTLTVVIIRSRSNSVRLSLMMFVSIHS